ncbi:MAG: fasciclin domain-containing protein [Chitinophagaceae bacterium]|nr:fasciclin domain-containing protein [Chitinophagaceae bacterium]
MSNKGLKYLLGILLATAVGACKKDDGGSAGTHPQYDKNYYGRQAFVIALNSNYQNYDSALKQTGLIDTLASTGPFTTFLLSNNSLPPYSFPTDINFILKSLILPGNVSLKALPFGRNQRFTSLMGNHIYLSKYPSGTDSAAYILNGTPVFAVDNSTTNGPLNVIDQTIPNLERYSSITGFVQGAKELTFLSLALRRTGLDKLLADTTRNFTFLAPADDAFKKSTDGDLNSYDGLLQADTAKLSRILRLHIIGERNFYTDLNRQLGNADTMAITTLLGNDPQIKFYASRQWWGATYYFIGPGNWDNSTNPPTAYPAGVYQINWVPQQDKIAVNGVILELDNILLP